MLGYTTARKALKEGFTHHGRYYGIPLWVAPDKDFMVDTKITWLWPLFLLAIGFEDLLRSAFFPERDPAFMFQVGKPIEVKNA